MTFCKIIIYFFFSSKRYFIIKPLKGISLWVALVELTQFGTCPVNYPSVQFIKPDIFREVPSFDLF